MKPPRLFEGFHVWVIAPSVLSDDPNISYYYDFDQSIKEYSKVFEELHMSWNWQPIRLDNYKQIIQQIKLDAAQRKVLVLNLCDGDEINQAPGISVIKELEASELTYTGSCEYFYDITTSKIPMKRIFDEANILNPEWEVIKIDGSNMEGIFHRISRPLIIKPAVSGGSMGIGISNVVENESEFIASLDKIKKGYRGWNLTIDGIFVERFIPGREFTTLIVGSWDQKEEIIYYKPIERVFNKNLPKKEQFLSFDRLWETYDEETSLGTDEFLYHYVAPEIDLHEEIYSLSMQTYTALQGTGYTRIDFRMDENNNKLYVLEANAQCGLSDDENFTSIGAILKVNDKSFSELISEIMNDAIRRKIK